MTITGVDWNEKDPDIADAVLIPLHPEFRAEGGGVFEKAASVVPHDTCGTMNRYTVTSYGDTKLPSKGIIHVLPVENKGKLSESDVRFLIEHALLCANAHRIRSIAIPRLSSITDVEMGIVLKYAADYIRTVSLTVDTIVLQNAA